VVDVVVVVYGRCVRCQCIPLLCCVWQCGGVWCACVVFRIRVCPFLLYIFFLCVVHMLVVMLLYVQTNKHGLCVVYVTVNVLGRQLLQFEE